MKLGDILRSAGTAKPINPRPVSFLAIGEDEGMRPIKAKVDAVLACVGENDRAQARVDAVAALRKRFPDAEIPEQVSRDEEVFHILLRALRDKEPNEAGYHPRLCENMTELRAALVLPEARRLRAEYDQFMLEEFPEEIDQETWAKLVEDAKKNSAIDLLTSYGYASVVRALSSLAGPSSR